MAGGTWASQNKVRPGVYIRFASDRGLGLTVSDRGVVAIAEAMSWGPVETVQEIEAGANMTPYTGYDITNPKNRFLNEIFKGTNRTAAPNMPVRRALPTAPIFIPATGMSHTARPPDGGYWCHGL